MIGWWQHQLCARLQAQHPHGYIGIRFGGQGLWGWSKRLSIAECASDALYVVAVAIVISAGDVRSVFFSRTSGSVALPSCLRAAGSAKSETCGEDWGCRYAEAGTFQHAQCLRRWSVTACRGCRNEPVHLRSRCGRRILPRLSRWSQSCGLSATENF